MSERLLRASVTEAVAANAQIPMIIAVKLLILGPPKRTNQIGLVAPKFIPPTACGKQEVPKPSARPAVASVATQPFME